MTARLIPKPFNSICHVWNLFNIFETEGVLFYVVPKPSSSLVDKGSLSSVLMVLRSCISQCGALELLARGEQSKKPYPHLTPNDL